MGAFERLFIDYNQFIIATIVGGDLPIYTVGDGLVHQVGAGSLTVIAGLYRCDPGACGGAGRATEA